MSPAPGRLNWIAAICVSAAMTGCAEQQSTDSTITSSSIVLKPLEHAAAPESVSTTVVADKATPADKTKVDKPAAPKAQPLTSVPADWTVYRMPEAGFSLAVPPDWFQISLQADAFEASIKKAIQLYPEMKKLQATMRQQVKAGGKFMAFDRTMLSPDFRTNVNVIRMELPYAMIPSEVVDYNLQFLTQNLKPLNEPVREIRHTALGRTERIRYEVNMNAPGKGNIRAAFTQYFYIDGRSCYVITFTTRADVKDRYETKMTQICESFRLINH